MHIIHDSSHWLIYTYSDPEIEIRRDQTQETIPVELPLFYITK